MDIDFSVDIDMDSLAKICEKSIESCQDRSSLELEIAQAIISSLVLRVTYSKQLRVKFDFDKE